MEAKISRADWEKMTEMNAKLVDSLIQIIQSLSVSERKLLDSRLATLHRSSQFQQWDQISDAEAATLKAEFAQEDVALAEVLLPDHFTNLQQQDCV